ncbi:serine/threonine-protein kinase Nek3 [Elysia marginata]|uniref:Serine/threonine-protein kinase Nek3 n=1 Tax=Elysia marginata TaxID=1093978 RepID=A0AAV4IG24_9GAST|nr:serine/threonine-protein kinase Nek3 [Elysia marginata]
MAQHFQTEDPMPIVDLKDGRFFPHFNLKYIRVIGKGHDGRVILASSASGFLAVKKIERSENTPRRTRRFFTEVNIMRSLSHPHLVPCYQAAMCDAYFAYSMPWYPGGDLTTVRRGHHPMDTATILRCMIEVSLAVEYLHERCLAHLDVKLENVFLDRADHAHLGDLGLLKHVTTESRTLPARGLGGTYAYLGPERFQAGPQDSIDPFKCDVYAVGVMCWLLVSKDKPGVNVDYQARVRTATGLRMSLRSALEQMLEANPAQRPTVSKVLELLFVASMF